MRSQYRLKHCALSLSFSAVFFLPATNANAGTFCTDLLDAVKNPLGKYQWHLLNSGQTAFASESGASGEDINAMVALSQDCLSGNGVYVAVVDTGIEVNHPSLKPNVDNRPYQSKTWSVNFRHNNLKPNDPSPVESDGDDHGTMVSGIIAMRSNLGFGGSGVAPQAHLSGYNIIQDDTQEYSNFLDSLGGSDASRGNDIFSMSYGFNNSSQLPVTEPTIMAAITSYRYGTRELRNGKGALYVKAAGNGFYRLGFGGCAGVKYGLTCQNSSMNPDNSMPEVITVGALNAKGVKSSYSTTGSSLWVSAPGGEFAFDKTWVNANRVRLGEAALNWSEYRKTLGEPAIVTTDMMGSRAGMSKYVDLNNVEEIFAIRNAFNACRDVPENLDCNYTNSMNGTSSATPVTSGVVALILEANPALGWRDVKHVLAMTATKVDTAQKAVELDLLRGKYVAEQGWVKNAAGYSFSNWYGFGRVNATEAAHYAASHYDATGHALNPADDLGTYIEKRWVPENNETTLTVPQGDPQGLTQSVTVLENDNLSIESIQVQVSVAETPLSDIGFELTSPSGTKSVIWNVANGFVEGALDKQQIQSNAFYGEKSAGKWTLRVVNAGLNKTDATFKGWKLRVVGHQQST